MPQGHSLVQGRMIGQTKIPPLNNIYSAFAGYANTILGLRSGRIVVLGDQTNGVAVSRTPTRTP